MSTLKRKHEEEPSPSGEKKVKTAILKDQEDDEFDDLEDSIQLESARPKEMNSDMYLDTINRRVLNFDLPLACNSSLATTNIHICLVCNRYLQGASINSPAYMHAVDSNHHIFLNTQTLKFIVLPEQLELSKEKTDGLRDIQLLFKPEFTDTLLSKFDTTTIEGKTLTHEKYTAGFIPLINDNILAIKDPDSKDKNETLIHNTLYYSLSHISAIRDYLIRFTLSDSTPLTNHMSNLVKKIWSPFLFRNLTSSYAIENYLVSCRVGSQIREDVRLFYIWIVNILIKENTRLKTLFTGKLILTNRPEKSVKFINLSISLPQQSVFKDGSSSSIEQYDLLSLIKAKNIQIINAPKVLTIFIDRSNPMKIEGINQTLNMSIVKFDPDLLEINNFKYRLVANITYENKVQVFNKASGNWMEFDGVNVKDVEKELLFIFNCKLQFWELI